MIDKQNFNNIIEEIKKLKKGSTFCIETYLEKYKVTDLQDKFDITFEILAELDKKIELKDKELILGLPWVFTYIKK